VSSHAVRETDSPVAALRYADLVLLAFALPVFLLAGLPMAGYAVTAAVWLAQRGIRVVLNRRARAAHEPRTVAGLMVASMLVRGWLVAGAIFAVGLADNDAGLAAAVLSLALFSVYLSLQMALRPFDSEGGAP
jgi:hypothetical protein